VADRTFTQDEDNIALRQVRPLAERMVEVRARLGELEDEQREVVRIVAGNGSGEGVGDARTPEFAKLAVPAFIAVFIAISAIDQALHGSKEQGLVPKHWEPSHAGAYAANFVIVAAVAPFTEELLFRGLGFSLLEHFGKWPAILTVGIAFGLYHGLVQALPELALFGCTLAWLRWKTGSVFPGMIVHATFNTIGLLSMFL